MIGILNDLAKKHIEQLVKETYPEIPKNKIIAGDCRFNYKCHLNSVHEAIKNNQDQIAICIYFNEVDDLIGLHFMNYNKETDMYIENTHGEFSQIFSYYFLEYLHKDFFWKTGIPFLNWRNFFRTKLPWWLQLLSDFEV